MSGSQKVRRRGPRHRLFVGAMLLPTLLFMALWVILPTVLSIGLGFTSYFLGGSIEWVGLENFGRLLSDASFWNSANITIIYVAEAGLPVVILATVVGRLISGTAFANGAVMTALFIPFVFPGVAIAIVFGFLLAPYGPVNQALGTEIAWLTDSKTALVAVSFVTAWGLLGYFAIVMAAAFRQIPPEVLEAAKLDGAGGLRTFIHVELPMVRPALVFTSITVVASILTNFGTPFVMTRGGPSEATTTLPLFVFNQAFRYGDTGYASVAATVLLVMAMVIVVLVVGLLRDTNSRNKRMA